MPISSGAGRNEVGSVDEMCSEARLSELYELGMRRFDYRMGETAVSSIVASYRS